MAIQIWPDVVLPLQIASGSALATSVTLTDISPTPVNVIPANRLVLGTTIRVTASGQFSTTGTPTLLVGVYYGGVAGVALAATAATTTGTGAAAWPWRLVYQGRVRALTASGSIVGQGNMHMGTSLTALNDVALPATAAARTVTIDTTAAKSITIGAQWGTSSASNTITCDEILVELIG